MIYGKRLKQSSLTDLSTYVVRKPHFPHLKKHEMYSWLSFSSTSLACAYSGVGILAISKCIEAAKRGVKLSLKCFAEEPFLLDGQLVHIMTAWTFSLNPPHDGIPIPCNRVSQERIEMSSRLNTLESKLLCSIELSNISKNIGHLKHKKDLINYLKQASMECSSTDVRSVLDEMVECECNMDILTQKIEELKEKLTQSTKESKEIQNQISEKDMSNLDDFATKYRDLVETLRIQIGKNPVPIKDIIKYAEQIGTTPDDNGIFDSVIVRNILTPAGTMDMSQLDEMLNFIQKLRTMVETLDNKNVDLRESLNKLLHNCTSSLARFLLENGAINSNVLDSYCNACNIPNKSFALEREASRKDCSASFSLADISSELEIVLQIPVLEDSIIKGLQDITNDASSIHFSPTETRKRALEHVHMQVKNMKPNWCVIADPTSNKRQKWNAYEQYMKSKFVQICAKNATYKDSLRTCLNTKPMLSDFLNRLEAQDLQNMKREIKHLRNEVSKLNEQKEVLKDSTNQTTVPVKDEAQAEILISMPDDDGEEIEKEENKEEEADENDDDKIIDVPISI